MAAQAAIHDTPAVLSSGGILALARRTMTRSLPLRATLAAAVTFLAAATALVLAIGWQANVAMSQRTLDDLQSDLSELQKIDARDGRAALLAHVNQRTVSGEAAPRLLSVWTGSDGVVAGSRLLEYSSERVFELHTNSRTVLYARLRGALTALPRQPEATVLVARDITDQRALARRIQWTAFAGLAALGVLALAFGLAARRQLLARVTTISTTSQAIMAGDLSQRIPRDASGDELDTLAASLNDMLGRIDDLMQALREVSDNIAHDLKTPINRLRITAEEALREPANAPGHQEALGAVIEQADGIIQTFNALLQIARLKPGVHGDTLRDDIDLATLVTDVTDLYAPVAEDAHMIIRLLEADPTPYQGSRQLLGQALANLIDNAIKYSSDMARPGVMPIDITLKRLSDGVEIIVADHGPGIAPEDRAKALQRFGRLDASRTLPGTGLGLSLVAAIGPECGTVTPAWPDRSAAAKTPAPVIKELFRQELQHRAGSNGQSIYQLLQWRGRPVALQTLLTVFSAVSSKKCPPSIASYDPSTLRMIGTYDCTEPSLVN
jgi:signal transduction histidine kinase